MKATSTLNLGIANHVVAYIRGSTEKQQHTLTSQETRIRQYCEFREKTLVKVFVDSGTSAKRVRCFQRPVIREMLDYMTIHGITEWIITDIDRAFRNPTDCGVTLEELNNRGISFHCIQMQLDTSSPVGKLIIGVLSHVAGFESDIRAERQVNAFASMKDRFMRSGQIPYGWDTIPAADRRTSKTGRAAEDLTPNPYEQNVLTWILSLHDQGTSLSNIARQLNGANIPSKNAGMISRDSKSQPIIYSGKWHASTVKKVLANTVAAEPAAETQLAA